MQPDRPHTRELWQKKKHSMIRGPSEGVDAGVRALSQGGKRAFMTNKGEFSYNSFGAAKNMKNSGQSAGGDASKSGKD